MQKEHCRHLATTVQFLRSNYRLANSEFKMKFYLVKNGFIGRYAWYMGGCQLLAVIRSR